MKRSIFSLLFLVTIAGAADLRVAPTGQLSDELTRYLLSRAEQAWTARRSSVAALHSKADVQKRQEFIRHWMVEAIGGWPEKTPLNARVTGGFDRDGYRVENLVFESRPKFYVTANVYVPTNVKPPFPAVVGVAGHSATGKAIDTYQSAWIGMVKRGFLVVAFDPPGQGERLEYMDPKTGKSPGPTREHDLAGVQCLLTGSTFAQYESWDGIRAVDYLLTRTDVDPKRIAVAGNSGGGTQSAYLAVFEPRLAAAVVSCYMTDWERLWSGPGPQDSEQNFPGFLSSGLDFGDYMIAFGPKPITMLTGTRDFFPIAGGHATYAEVKHVFEVMDAPGRAGFFEYDDTHGWHKERREATYRWLTKWLQGKDDDGTEPPMQVEPDAKLNVTSTGQVATSLGGETVRSLNLKRAEQQFGSRRAASLTDTKSLRELVAKKLNLPQRSGAPSATSAGKETAAGGEAEKLLIETEPGIHVAALFFPSRKTGRQPAVLYINSAGKAADLSAIEKLVQDGNAVLAVDPRGWGESAIQKGASGYSPEGQLAQRAMLLGKSLVAMQTFDVLRAFDYLSKRAEVDAKRISIHGSGNGGVVALYAGAVEPAIQKVTSEKSVASYMTIARATRHSGVVGVVVPGVLRDFDLPDVAAAIAPRPLEIASAQDAEGKALDRSAVDREYAPAIQRYTQMKRANALTITQ